jgi:phosphohistidine phosphatase
MAVWLKSFLPKRVKVLCSPACRTRQTADALGLPYDVCDDLAPEADEAQILRACDWPGASGQDEKKETIIAVGHQPSLGRAAALLITQAPADWTLRKGAVWWFSSGAEEGDANAILKAAMSPDLLGVKK